MTASRKRNGRKKKKVSDHRITGHQRLQEVSEDLQLRQGRHKDRFVAVIKNHIRSPRMNPSAHESKRSGGQGSLRYLAYLMTRKQKRDKKGLMLHNPLRANLQ